jgi:hypothetical protein
MNIGMLGKDIDVYEIDGKKIGKGRVKKVKGKIVGYEVEADEGSKFLVMKDTVEKIRDSVVILPDWVKKAREIMEKMKKYEEVYPEIKSKEEIERNGELYAFHKEVLKTVRILEEKERRYREMKDEILLEIARYIGMRMINEISFIEFSKKMEELQRKYKIVNLNHERCQMYIDLLKSSPFYYEEIRNHEIEEIRREVEELLEEG